MKGETVTLKTVPEEGYEADSVNVRDKDGKVLEVLAGSNGQYKNFHVLAPFADVYA